jgi:hypothetical protein
VKWICERWPSFPFRFKFCFLCCFLCANEAIMVVPWMKEVRDNTSRRGGPTYAARSLPQYISAFAMRVLQSTNVCVKGEGERAWARIFKLFRTPGISSTELVDLFRICSFAGYSSLHYTAGTSTSNDIETKANESFNNGVFFDIKAKQTHSIVRKLFLKQSEHVR